MLWEKYCRFEEEKDWYKSKLGKGGSFFDRVKTLAFLEFECLGSEPVRVPAKLLSWPAFCFGAFWFLYKRQRLLGLILIAFYIIYPKLIVYFHIFLGLAGNKCLELYLLRRGYNFKEILVRERIEYDGKSRYGSSYHEDTWWSYDNQGWRETREEEIRKPQEARQREQQREQEEAWRKQEEAERKAFILEKMGGPKKTTDEDG